MESRYPPRGARSPLRDQIHGVPRHEEGTLRQLEPQRPCPRH